MARKNKSFIQGLYIQQVGATPLRTPKGTVFKLGGGIFTKRQIVESRKRYGRTMFGKMRL
jgi:hypothetical protein